MNATNFENYNSLISSDQNTFYSINSTNEENAKTMAMYAAAAAQMYYGAAPENVQQQPNEMQQLNQQQYSYYLNADSNIDEANVLPQFRLFQPLQTELNLNFRNVEENSFINASNNNTDLQLKYALL